MLRPGAAVTVTTAVTTRVLSGFDDPTFGAEQWQRLLESGPVDTFDLTPQVQRAWWETNGTGRLLLIVASRDGEDVALAPLFEAGGMVFNIAIKDQLDVVGDATDPAVLDAIIVTAREATPGFLGLRLYFISDESPTRAGLPGAAARAGLGCFEEESIPTPYLPIASNLEAATAATRKKTLRYRENVLRRGGELEVTHLSDGRAIAEQLPAFFAQHVARRRELADRSLFEEPEARAFYTRMTHLAGDTGALRFTRLDWNDEPIAFHYGSCHRGRYLYVIPSFDLGMASYSPGAVLLRHLFLAAIEEGAERFDFGIGDEPYKYRFAGNQKVLRTWGLYPA